MTEFLKGALPKALKHILSHGKCLWDCIQSYVLKHSLLKFDRLYTEKQWIAYYLQYSIFSLVSCLSSNYHH